jgi:hypothetical protein
MSKPKIRARYAVKPLGVVERVVTKAIIDKETKAMDTKRVRVSEEMFMVFFPQGHSTRMTKKELMSHNLHLKPRMVDMNTGDIVDVGGDPYDFANMPIVDEVAEDEFDLDELIKSDADNSPKKKHEKVES